MNRSFTSPPVQGGSTAEGGEGGWLPFRKLGDLASLGPLDPPTGDRSPHQWGDNAMAHVRIPS